MKQYGAMFATEFTKKQISVIYSKAKAGELKIEKWFMSELYNLADFYGYDSNRSVARTEIEVKNILEAVFAGDTEKAQQLINKYTSAWYNAYGRKTQAKCDRTVFAA